MPLTPLQEVHDLVERIGERRALYELNVHRTTLGRWLKGQVPVPAAALRHLRQLAYDVGADPEWQGWRFRDGLLHSPEGYEFTPGDLYAIRFLKGQISALQTEVRTLKGTIDQVKREAAQRDKAANDIVSDFIPAKA